MEMDSWIDESMNRSEEPAYPETLATDGNSTSIRPSPASSADTIAVVASFTISVYESGL
jgi:hypothetical protein